MNPMFCPGWTPGTEKGEKGTARMIQIKYNKIYSSIGTSDQDWITSCDKYTRECKMLMGEGGRRDGEGRGSWAPGSHRHEEVQPHVGQLLLNTTWSLEDGLCYRESPHMLKWFH